MTLLDHHDLQPFWDLAGAQVKIKALETAISTSLFDVMLSPCTVEQVIQNLMVHKNVTLNIRNTEVWLDLLWSMNCLDKTAKNKVEVQYSTSHMAKRYLVKSSLFDCSQALYFRFQTLKRVADDFEQLLQILDTISDEKRDKSFDEPKHATDKIDTNVATLWAGAAKAQIFQEQKSVTVPAFNMIMTHIVAPVHSVPRNMCFLDLGCGPGLVAIALAERFKKATGVVFDFPETVDVAHDNIINAGLQNRLSIQSGNFNITQPKGTFDLIWCSSVLHFLDDADAAIARIATLLKPNGILLLLHAEQTLDKNNCARVLPFYLPMVMKGNYLPKQGSIPKILKKYGIDIISSEEVSYFPMSPVCLYFARKLA